ncbi:MAG: short-chain dehydrogenase/reductase [Rhodospirillales bacterium 20-64-7]|nr:MAG: short-chain dehydrogenase/reductase [Rhodospirillales bacterium 20-64-7]
MADTTLVWLITGCSTGFGRELALEALEKGHRVVATARNPATLEDIVSKYQDRALAQALDVTRPEDVARAVQAAEARFGRIDVLVNNAGYGYLAAIEEGEDAKVRGMFEANVFGLVEMTKAVLPGMRKQRSGHIVNISSIGGLVGFGATGYYHATKFAVEGLSESLAIETAPLGIKVTIVEPGPFRTDWAGRSIQQSATRIPDYEPTAGKRRNETAARSGNQPGDPRRAAQAIMQAVAAAEPPLHLVLGRPALELARKKVASLSGELDRWADLTLSADFPDPQKAA